MALFLIVMVTLLKFSTAQNDYETYPSEVVEDYGKMTLIKIPKESRRYVGVDIIELSFTTSDNLTAVAEYCDEKLTPYFDGDNEDGVRIDQTTPLYIWIQDLSISAAGSYRIPSNMENVPYAYDPLGTAKYGEDGYYFVRKTEKDALSDVQLIANEMYADIEELGVAVDTCTLLFMHFGFPSGGIQRENEIWIWKMNDDEVHSTT